VTSLSFGHNLCLKCPNGSCKPILDIYIPRAFQWYKKIYNLIVFDPWNYSLKMGVHSGMWRFIPLHSPTLPGTWDVTFGLPSWLAPLQALALVANPRLGLQQPFCTKSACFMYLQTTLVIWFPLLDLGDSTLNLTMLDSRSFVINYKLSYPSSIIFITSRSWSLCKHLIGSNHLLGVSFLVGWSGDVTSLS